jgi:hypothetical protein
LGKLFYYSEKLFVEIKMAKRIKRKPRRYTDWNEEEWKNWEEKFGDRMEKRGRDFGEELGDLGERFGKRMEHKGKEWEGEWKGWWFRTFGLIGPLIGSIFGIAFIAVGIWLLNVVNLPVKNSFISLLSTFLSANLHWFFVAFLFFGYSDYFSKRFPRIYWMVSPIVTGIGVVVFVWVSLLILDLINIPVHSSLIMLFSNFLYENLLGIFILFVVLGYMIVFIKKLFMHSLNY